MNMASRFLQQHAGSCTLRQPVCSWRSLPRKRAGSHGHRTCARRKLCTTAAVTNGAGGSDSGQKPYVVTTPLYYVNAAPHMGSAYSTIATDVAARFHRLKKQQPVVFITGTDEHGEKIAAAAEAKQLSPQDHCNAVAAEFKSLWGKFDISADSFVRTTQPSHERLVQALLQRIYDKGDIYKAAYEGHYCVGCEKYMDDEEMGPNHTCPTHRTECKLRQEENYFFKLSKYQQQLQQLMHDRPDFVQPAPRRNEVLGWIKSGAKDFSLSRSKVEWGIRIPWDPSQTIYVWIDALHGYMSALLDDNQDVSVETLDRLTEAGWPADVHVIGKDILRFHAVMWPALLMSAELPLPGKVFAHGFLTKDGHKMGKSLGNVLDPNVLVEAYGADAVRFFFLKEVTFGSDGDFSEERFQNIVNANLANDIGNLLNRSLNLLHKFCDGEYPVNSSDAPESAVLRQVATRQSKAAVEAYERWDFSGAAEAVLAISGRGNGYMEEQAPWGTLKKGNDEQKAQGRQVLADVLEALRIVALLISPITPSLAQAMYTQLGFSEENVKQLSLADAAWGGLKKGHALSKPVPVFKRIDQEFVTEPAAAVAGKR